MGGKSRFSSLIQDGAFVVGSTRECPPGTVLLEGQTSPSIHTLQRTWTLPYFSGKGNSHRAEVSRRAEVGRVLGEPHKEQKQEEEQKRENDGLEQGDPTSEAMDQQASSFMPDGGEAEIEVLQR